MARLLVALEEIAIRIGGKQLFEGLNLHISEGDKICLIGKNGAGKTTLMKLITGDLEPDAGKRFLLPGLTVGNLAQQVAFDSAQPVRDFVLRGLSGSQHQESQWQDNSYLADMVLAPLELSPDALMGQLSGGQIRRASLAQALVCEPDLLLLDEPTNHMDLQAIEWLEGMLASYRGALVCVSHDRAFLKAISRKLFWLDRGTVRTRNHGYDGFEEWAEELLEQEARELQNAEKRLQAEVDWTQGGVTGRRKRNVRRLRNLETLREKLRNDKASYRQFTARIALDALAPTQASKIAVEFKGVSKAYPEKPILDGFHLRIMKGDRIGILGRNGSGKSTFLKLLTGNLEPDSGQIFRSKTLDIAYFDQHRVALQPQKTAKDILCPDGGDYVFIGQGEQQRQVHVCGYLKQFLFDPKQAWDAVGTLSGGQQNRLLLAKVLSQPGNLLILDEPTNDLDMDTLDMLQEMLADYSGTLLVVSHDRDFLDRTVAQVLAFEGDAEVQGVVGGYSDYLAFKTRSQGGAKGQDRAVITVKSSAKPIKNTKKITFRDKHDHETLPARIAVLEADIARIEMQLADSTLYTRDPALFDTCTAQLQQAQQALTQAENRWLELEDMLSTVSETAS